MKINDRVTWVGINDSQLKKFHGDAYPTPNGTSYNAYLIQAEKTILIDTVFTSFADEFIENLRKKTPLEQIDYIVIQHGEIDHTGALIKLLEHIPDTPIYCSEECIYTLRGHFKKHLNCIPVRTGDKLKISDQQDLIFIETKMLHWPDSMMTFLTGDNILFSSDLYSQHIPINLPINIENQIDEAGKLYSNIFTPFSKLYLAKYQQIETYNWDFGLIAPGHGYIWYNPGLILQKYKDWSSYYSENQITILYDTMWGGTEILAKNISEGIKSHDSNIIVKTLKITDYHESDLIYEIFKSKAILIGSPTVNNGYLSTVATLINAIKGMRFRHKYATAFGCYGWSGEAVLQLKEELSFSGFNYFEHDLTSLWQPDEHKIFEAITLGKFIANKIKED